MGGKKGYFYTEKYLIPDIINFNITYDSHYFQVLRERLQSRARGHRDGKATINRNGLAGNEVR